ncbi:predicted protein [Aspergillus terreus NIH2624]|uniref:Uncharacterized protein n=1 Tax=Aspergillus terreus (strain NIH 2624 / FGSC A1156) TaxID=341663 RepID=Q0CQY3_ASPTN|nr:uncharacterized protein ATEG_03901 [Aspergillus terreus NIH2624]EAU35703.1 predicted protein [Aspergillus terreus NIH2624]
MHLPGFSVCRTEAPKKAYPAPKRGPESAYRKQHPCASIVHGQAQVVVRWRRPCDMIGKIARSSSACNPDHQPRVQLLGGVLETPLVSRWSLYPIIQNAT